nr:MAG TPA: hypothetical protein [Caudoviricetes sp.]
MNLKNCYVMLFLLISMHTDLNSAGQKRGVIILENNSLLKSML